MLEIRHRTVVQGGSTRDAYDDFYERQGFDLRDSLYLWLIELLRAEPGASLLDISCGYGRLVELAAKRGLIASGVDFSLEAMARGVMHSPHLRWLAGDGEQLPLPDDSFDYVTHIGSLEHYGQPVRGASEIARVLKPGGRACILLPNAYGLLGNVQYVWQHGEIFDDGQPLQRYATRATWQAVLERGGLQIERVATYGEVDRPRTAADWRWLLRRPQKIVRAALTFLAPTNLSNHFVFLCRPTSPPTTSLSIAPPRYPTLPLG